MVSTTGRVRRGLNRRRACEIRADPWHAVTVLAPGPGRSSWDAHTSLPALSQLQVFGTPCHSQEGLHSYSAGKLASQGRGRVSGHYVLPHEREMGRLHPSLLQSRP